MIRSINFRKIRTTILILSVLVATALMHAQVTPCSPTSETYTDNLLGVSGTTLAMPGNCQLNTVPALNSNFAHIATAFNSLSTGPGVTINGQTGAITFEGDGVSCSGTPLVCTISGSGGGGAVSSGPTGRRHHCFSLRSAF